MKTDKLVSYLKQTEKIAIRSLGHLGQAENNCSYCSVYGDNIEPAKTDLGNAIGRINALYTTLEKGE
jgi:hypothetical protein